VLITGEQGTGKKLVARTIHSLSRRKSKPFVAIDCSTLAPTLLKSELFGYTKGAFLGAAGSQWGALALAGQGTLFLGEVGEIPLALQTELAQVLQQGKFTPIGSMYAMPFHARVIAGTSRSLELAVKAGTFREDLFVALGARQIQLPPLRERRVDIPLLLDYFLEKYRPEQTPFTCSDSGLRFLQACDWPGNVREFENTVKRAIAQASGGFLRIRDLRLALRDETVVRPMIINRALPPEEIERREIVRALRDSGGDKTEAARRLGIGKAALSKRLKQHGISEP